MNNKYEEVNRNNITFHSIELPKLLRSKYLKNLEAIYLEEKFDIILLLKPDIL